MQAKNLWGGKTYTDLSREKSTKLLSKMSTTEQNIRYPCCKVPGVQAFPLICSVSLHGVDPFVPAYVVVDVEAANFTFDLCIDILDIHRGTQVF